MLDLIHMDFLFHPPPSTTPPATHPKIFKLYVLSMKRTITVKLLKWDYSRFCCYTFGRLYDLVFCCFCNLLCTFMIILDLVFCCLCNLFVCIHDYTFINKMTDFLDHSC